MAFPVKPKNAPFLKDGVAANVAKVPPVENDPFLKDGVAANVAKVDPFKDNTPSFIKQGVAANSTPNPGLRPVAFTKLNKRFGK